MSKIFDKTQTILQRKDLKTIGGLFGLYVASKLALKTLSALWYILKPRRDLLRRYGNNTWAVVTGATDGIGKQYSKELASLGFNVVLVSRSEKKLEAVKSELEKEFPNVQFRILAADFSKSLENGFFQHIEKELKELDVSILINNVGIMDAFFWESPVNYTKNVLAVNQMSCVMMTKLLVEHFKTRKHRSLIVNVSADIGVVAVATATLLGSTKRFVDFFSRSLSEEYKDRIDIISHICGPVMTPSAAEVVGESSGISLKSCVHGVLAQAGYETRAGGHWQHQIHFKFLSSWLGKRIMVPVLDNYLQDVLRKHPLS